jgi:hypothetical protein
MCNTGRSEPSLDELFRDNAIQLLMRRDGVKESDVRALLKQLRAARAAVPDGTMLEHNAPYIRIMPKARHICHQPNGGGAGQGSVSN